VATATFAPPIVVLVNRLPCATEADMNLRNAVAVLACLVCTLAAVLALGSLSTWLVDDSGSETRAAVRLANAPWFDRDAIVVPPRAEPGAAPAPHARRHAAGATHAKD
jgi:hypothetical protein